LYILVVGELKEASLDRCFAKDQSSGGHGGCFCTSGDDA
jgi:hypothetical protein